MKCSHIVNPSEYFRFYFRVKNHKGVDCIEYTNSLRKHISRSDTFPKLSRSEHILLSEDCISVVLKIILLNEDLSK